jgi:hypothetical protein
MFLTMTRRSLFAAAIALAGLGYAAPASAEFFGWQITGVGSDDVLKVRASPAAYGQILVGYPNATPLSLTGKCTNNLNLNSINGQSAATQAAAVRFRWCEIWLDPLGSGTFQSGWVYGKYIRPL